MEGVWKYTMTRKVSWKECQGPGSSVRTPLEDLDMIVSRDSRNMS